MDAILNEIEQEAIAYFKKEEDDKNKEEDSLRITLRRRYFWLKMRVADMNRLKDKEAASEARRALKLFRMEHKLDGYNTLAKTLAETFAKT
jgi:hypothetical protein